MHSLLKRTKPNGFTIVELLIVIIIIGILATITIVTYNGIQNRAIDKGVQSDLDGISSALTHYQVTHSGQLDSSVAWYSPSGVNTTLGYTPTAGNIVDVVVNTTDYCVRIYNSSSATYKTLSTAATQESTPGSCTTLAPSAAATADASLLPPTTVTLSSDSTSQITANWSTVSGASSYKVEYSTSCTFANSSFITGISGISQAIGGLSVATGYYVRVYTVKGLATSAASTAQKAITQGSLSTPVNFSATLQSPGNVQVSWSAVSGATSYTVESSTNDSNFCPATTRVTTSSTGYVISFAHGTTKYYFRVYATNGGAKSVPTSGATWVIP